MINFAFAVEQNPVMLNFLKPEAPNLTPQEFARSLRWAGWTGFWLQALLGFIPIFVVVINVLSRPQRQASGFSLGLLLAIVCLFFLVFSIYWCFRYTQLAKNLESYEARPARSAVVRDLKIGLIANISVMAIAVSIALARVGALTFKMLTLPQNATVVAPNQLGTTLASPGALITPSNMIAIQSMISAIAAGLVGTVVALVLLYQMLYQTGKSPNT